MSYIQDQTIDGVDNFNFDFLNIMKMKNKEILYYYIIFIH